MFKYLSILTFVLFALVTFNVSYTAAEKPLDKTYEAHGGLDNWHNQYSLTYRMIGFPLSPQVAKPNISTVDLKNRYNRIQSEEFIVGFDGEQAWSDPGPEAVGLKPRFFSLGSFYFVGIPFVFADPGVVLTNEGSTTFNGKTYKFVKAGFEKGVGHTSNDEYYVLIDPETNRVALISHTVTEVAEVERVTWVYDEWQTVNGLLIPSKLTFYPGWNPEDPGKGASYTVDNAKFSTESPDKSIYKPTAKAVIDNSPSLH